MLWFIAVSVCKVPSYCRDKGRQLHNYLHMAHRFPIKRCSPGDRYKYYIAVVDYCMCTVGLCNYIMSYVLCGRA